ncbi:MAG: hypothetical protein AB1403_23125, partial [Candidatus Riflebacteria bacterium]
LNTCRGNNGKSLFKIFTDKDRLISEYGFGKNCHYYDLENWPEYEKKPPTEEEIQKFNEINKRWHEESAKRDKENERINDETFVRNALDSLKHPDLTPQEKEYLERCINHIRNKKYEK